MSLYPSLEDMKFDQMTKAQIQVANEAHNLNTRSVEADNVYPSLGNYMGLELSSEIIRANMPEYLHNTSIYQQTITPSDNFNMIAPISGQSVGLRKGQVTNGIREVILCKDKDNKVGVRVKEISKGVFISLVVNNSPAAMAGLKFGDQILQINGVNIAGFSMDKVHQMFKNSPVNGIKVAVRDRPFERAITLHKDSAGCLGFQYKNGKITTIVKDSSAARNGVLIDHQLLEVNGQNVIGLKDKQLKEIIEKGGDVVTITVVPSFMYDHMVKKMAGSLITGLMDHSVPDL